MQRRPPLPIVILDDSVSKTDEQRALWTWRLAELDHILSARQMAEFSVTLTFAAAPEQVFDAWLDPAIARRFLFATRGGEMIRAEIDPKVGGRFTFVDRRPDMGDVLHTGEYLEVNRPRRLAFTFAVPQFNPDYTRIIVEIVPAAGGGSTVTLTQTQVSAEWADRSKEGWGMILDYLGRGLAP